MNSSNHDILQIVSAFETVYGLTREQLLSKKRTRQYSMGRNLLTAVMAIHPTGFSVKNIGAVVGRTYDVGISLWGTIIFEIANYEDINTMFNDILDILDIPDNDNIFRKNKDTVQKARTKVIGKYLGDSIIFSNGGKKPVIIPRRLLNEDAENRLKSHLDLFRLRVLYNKENLNIIACTR